MVGAHLQLMRAQPAVRQQCSMYACMATEPVLHGQSGSQVSESESVWADSYKYTCGEGMASAVVHGCSSVQQVYMATDGVCKAVAKRLSSVNQSPKYTSCRYANALSLVAVMVAQSAMWQGPAGEPHTWFSSTHCSIIDRTATLSATKQCFSGSPLSGDVPFMASHDSMEARS